MKKVFVYGTLMSEMSRSDILNASTYEGTGTIQAKMYDLGKYPGIISGNDMVHGEIYTIEDDTLDYLDMIEGYSSDNKQGSLYIRQSVPVTTYDDTIETAYTYFYNGSVENCTHVPSGHYKYHLSRKK